MAMSGIQEDLVQFKIMMLRAMPFYGDIMTKLSIVEYPSIPTAATDGLRIMYNADFMKSLDVAERNFVFMHEVFHVLLRHTVRKKERNPKLWNIAADIVVNDMLKHRLEPNMNKAGIPFKAPKNGVFAEVTFSESVETIYDKLVQDNAGRKESDNRVKVRDRYSNYGKSSTHEIISRQDLRPEDIVIKIGDCEPGGDCLSGKYHSASELLDDDKVREILAGLVREATAKDNVGRSATGSYFIPEPVLDITKGKALNWKSILKKYMIQRQSDDSSYATPERKYIHMDLILPGHCEDEETIEEVWAFVDTSGSIATEQLQMFLRQLYVIVKDCGCVLNLAYWDTEVTEVYRGIDRAKDLEHSLPHHSGGTDINCVYEWMVQEKVKPDVLLILTDGYYGYLRDEYRSAKLRKNTIQIINGTHIVTDDILAVGRVTSL